MRRESASGKGDRLSVVVGLSSCHDHASDDRDRPLQRHRDPPHRRDAPVHVRGGGGRRAEARGSDREPAAGDGRGSPRQGGGRVPAVGDDVQRDRAARALPAGRGDAGPPHRASHSLRDRRPRRAGRGQHPAARRAAWPVRRGGAGGGHPPRLPSLPPQPPGVGGADQQPGRWLDLAARARAGRDRRRPPPSPLHAPRRCPAPERGRGQRCRRPRLGGAVRLRLDRLHQGARGAGGRRAGRLARVHRRGVAAEAADGRRHAAGRHHRRRRRVRPPASRQAAR
jgi:hypothetical protein